MIRLDPPAGFGGQAQADADPVICDANIRLERRAMGGERHMRDVAAVDPRSLGTEEAVAAVGPVAASGADGRAIAQFDAIHPHSEQ